MSGASGLSNRQLSQAAQPSPTLLNYLQGFGSDPYPYQQAIAVSRSMFIQAPLNAHTIWRTVHGCQESLSTLETLMIPCIAQHIRSSLTLRSAPDIALKIGTSVSLGTWYIYMTYHHRAYRM